MYPSSGMLRSFVVAMMRSRVPARALKADSPSPVAMKCVAPIFSASAFFDGECEIAVTSAPIALANRRP